MSETNPPVVLAFSNPKMSVEETKSLLACASCRNKTYTVQYSEGAPFPRLTCAACGTFAGEFGWVQP